MLMLIQACIGVTSMMYKHIYKFVLDLILHWRQA